MSKRLKIKPNSPDFEIHHIIPFSEGGSSDPSNIVLVEAKLNRSAVFKSSVVFRELVRARGLHEITAKEVASMQDAILRSRNAEAKAEVQEPPALAEFMVSCIVSKKTRAAVLGDMEERFRSNLDRMSASRAQRLYWADAVKSLAPLVGRAFKRIGFAAMIWKALGGR